MNDWSSVGEPYRGYLIKGDAQPATAGYTDRQTWQPILTVMLIMPDNTCQSIEHRTETQISYDDKELTQFAALFLAELAVDHFIPPPAYYLRPMDIAWAVTIVRYATVECMNREIRRAKLYESLDFLEKALDKKSAWLVRHYRRELRWDRRSYREKKELREILRVTTRGIQQAAAKVILNRLNELGAHYRENKQEIDLLKSQLEIVRRPVPP